MVVGWGWGGGYNKVSFLIAVAHTAGMFPISFVYTPSCICKKPAVVSLLPLILIVCVCARMQQGLASRSVAGMLSGFQSDMRSHYADCFQATVMRRSCQKLKIHPYRSWSRASVFKRTEGKW